MKRLAIVEYTMSAGGVERVLKGLAGAFLQIPEAADWEVTLLLSRYNSAHRRVDWPDALTGPNLRVEWLGEDTAIARALRPLAHAQGIPGLGFTRIPGYVAARTLWRIGPAAMRAALGEHRALVQRAGDRFDALYLHYPFWMDPPPIRCPVLTTPTDFNFKFFLPEGSWQRRTHERALAAWLDRSDRLLVSSHAMNEELRRFYPQHAGKATVVPLGVDASPRVPARAELAECRTRLGLPDRFALVTGWITPHKNPLVVVRALGELRRRGLDLPVVFVGPNASHLADGPPPGLSAPYVESVRSAMREGGLVVGRDVFALGYVADEELQRLFRLATAYVFPTRYEGFGLPSLEATLSGCPAIVSAIPPLLEQDRALGGAYRTFEPDDAGALADHLASVLGNGEEARTRAQAAGARVAEHYDWRKTARGYLENVAAVLAGRSLSGR